jgi:hypothetical protein
MTNNKIYEFTLDHGHEITPFGKGTLKKGTELVKQIDDELYTRYNEWYKPTKDGRIVDNEVYFNFPFPYNKVSMAKADGAEISATRGEEILYFGFWYDNEMEEYVPMDEDETNYTEEYWA